MQNWKTTVSGICGSAAGLVLAFNAGGVAEPKWLIIVAGFVLAGGLAGLGINAKDSTTHSTQAEVNTSTAAQK
jgi:hypothetical protein